MDSEKQTTKRGRGRPRKNMESSEQKTKEEKKEKKDENIVLFLALSDEKSEDSGEDNRFTVNDTETKNDAMDSISDSDTNSNEISNVLSIGNSNNFGNSDKSNNKQLTVKMLIEEVKKRDVIIANLKNKTGSVLSNYATNKSSNINYHCVQTIHADTEKSFVPKVTDCECWWCDHTFNNLPAYIVNYYRSSTYFVFGNFCSFNCALKYNIKMLKDFKCDTRHALTNNLRIKVTNSSKPIKFAQERELLKSKGGKLTIEEFRHGFSVITENFKINMPPLIPLVHVIEDGR